MKFGTQLIQNLHSDWKFQYVDYDELKTLLKPAEEGLGFNVKHETAFVGRLESELEKVRLQARAVVLGLGLYG